MAEEIKDDVEDTLLPAHDLPTTEPRLRRTSISRLEQSPVVDDADADAAATARPSTILYLAFGSNMCAATFQGKRGIRPLSAVNVTAPTLRLTFSIPGLPYAEPCFANTAPRKVPVPEMPLPWETSSVVAGEEDDEHTLSPAPSPPQAADKDAEEGGEGGEPKWEKGLVGVVYEVTRADYKKIIATEGGGSSYKEILAPCLAIPPRMSVPENPADVVPRPFMARTLCMPFIPPGNENTAAAEDGFCAADSDDGGDDKDKDKGWWWWLLKSGQRPREDYAQPSKRYLDLLRVGAAEHELPDEYQAYLGALRAYEPTSARQRAGRFVMMLLWGPLILFIFGVSARLADEDGKTPTWLAAGTTLTFRAMWRAYDMVLKRVFGEGERTVVEGEGREDAWWRWKARGQGPIRLED